jgi:DNA-binding response OmpR family regulator
MPVIAITSHKSFDAAVSAFRAGAVDVILKAPEQLSLVEQRIDAIFSANRSESRVASDVVVVLEEFLRRLMDVSRRVAELDPRGYPGLAEADESSNRDFRVLIVEPDGWLADELRSSAERLLIRTATTGGEGIDVATGGRFQVALVRDQLPDLPGKMVVKGLKSQSPDTIAILFSRPNERPGRADVIEGSHEIPLVTEFREASQIGERMSELREAFDGKSRERRYLVAFRQQNYDLLKRYAEIKQKLERE